MAIKTHLQRILLIKNHIQNNPYITFEELQRNIEDDLFRRKYEPKCSRNTLQRDIQTIRELGVDIQYDHSNKGYYIDRSTTTISENNIMRFLDSLELLYAMNDEVVDFIFPEKYHSKGVEKLPLLIDAIQKSCCIEFYYLKYSDRTANYRITKTYKPNEIFEYEKTSLETHRRVEPYAIKEFRGRWYVIGKDKKDNKVKTFGLDRIEYLSMTTVRFTKDKDFDINEKYRHCFGIYSPNDNQIEKVILSFNKEDGGYLKAAPLHSSQEVISETDNEVVIKLRIHVTLDFIMELISRSWSLKVIEPSSLRKQIYDICKSALERNSM